MPGQALSDQLAASRIVVGDQDDFSGGWTAQAATANGQRAAKTHAPAADGGSGSAVVRRSWWTMSSRSCLTLGADAISSAV